MRKPITQTGSVEYEIEKNGQEKNRLLLHACCAPCSSSVIEYLHPYFKLSLYFYNPNILSESEFNLRLEAFKPLIERFPDVELIVPEQSENEFLPYIKGMEHIPEGGDRCGICFEIRLKATAEYVKKNKDKYNFFATTLTLSPHKNAKLINETGISAAEQAGVKYLTSDFKKRNGYLRSVELCKEMGIYRQNYCGCGFPDIGFVR